jgi:hypothetical protein
MRALRASAVAFLLAALPSSGASAQTQDGERIQRFTADAVVAVDLFGGENVSNVPQIVVDASAAVRVGDHWQLLFRPWWRKARPTTPTGAAPAWDAQLYQAALRYERPGRVATRVDVGQIVSPIGLGNLEWRPNLNPTIMPHLVYVVPMPLFDAAAPRQTPIAQNYPLGALVTVSTLRWDARAALVNVAPTRGWSIGADNNAHQTPVVEGGVGVTPIIGLRAGLSLARGLYATRGEMPLASFDDRMMTLVGGEAEYSVGYARFAGELTRTSFDTAAGTSVAYEYFIEGQQTLTPRWFAAARHEAASAPPLITSANPVRRMMKTVEATAGFRLTPEFTLRSSYYIRRGYTAVAWDHQVGVSVVWAKRWR